MGGDIVIISGPPGAGKTTVAAALALTYRRAVQLQSDDFWHYIVVGGLPPYLPESDAQNQTVSRVIASAAEIYAAGGFTVVVDGIVGPWMIDHYLEPLRSSPRSRLHYIVLRPSRKETLSRAQRRSTPGALVDEEPVLSMWDQFADLGALEPHVIDTTSQTLHDTLRAVQAAIREERHLLAAGMDRNRKSGAGASIDLSDDLDEGHS